MPERAGLQTQTDDGWVDYVQDLFCRSAQKQDEEMSPGAPVDVFQISASQPL